MFYIEDMPRIGTYDKYVDKINSFLTLIDDHDHFKLGNPVQASSIDFTYVYSFNGILNVNYLSYYSFDNFDVINTYTKNDFLFVEGVDLYYRKLGSTIRITKNASLDISLVGIGIRADYGLFGLKTSYNSGLQRYTFQNKIDLSNMECGDATFEILLTNKNIYPLSASVNTIIANKPTLEYKIDNGYLIINSFKQLEYSNLLIDEVVKFINYFIYNDAINILLNVANVNTTDTVIGSIYYYEPNAVSAFVLQSYYRTYLQFPFVSRGDRELYYHIMGNTNNDLSSPNQLRLSLKKGSNLIVYSPIPFDNDNYGSYLYFLNAKTELKSVTNYCDFMFINGDLNNHLAPSYIVNKIYLESDEDFEQKCLFAYYKV